MQIHIVIQTVLVIARDVNFHRQKGIRQPVSLPVKLAVHASVHQVAAKLDDGEHVLGILEEKLFRAVIVPVVIFLIVGAF